MVKVGKRKRKLAASSASEESSQSQDSVATQPKYVPRFGSVLKKARVDSNQMCSTQAQESNTQPPLTSCQAANESTSATQPVPVALLQSPLENYAKASVALSVGVDSPCSSDPALPEQNMIESCDTSTPPLASLTAKQSDQCAVTPEEQMNLDLLNPFSEDESLLAGNGKPLLVNEGEHLLINEGEPLLINDKELNEWEPLLDNNGEPLVINDEELNKKELLLLNEGEPLAGKKGGLLFVNQPNEDATLPSDQDFPTDTESFYDTHQDEGKKLKQNKDLFKIEMKTETNAASVSECVTECEVKSPDMEALVPVLPLNTDMGQDGRTFHNTHRPGYTFHQAPPCPPQISKEGPLKGLIQELSSINQYILRCKRELDSARKKREAWLRSKHQPRHR